MERRTAARERRRLRRLFYRRLQHLARLRQAETPTWTAAERWLIDRALLSTGQDCERVGLRTIARVVLAGLPHR
jgi:hypothetical protein